MHQEQLHIELFILLCRWCMLASLKRSNAPPQGSCLYVCLCLCVILCLYLCVAFVCLPVSVCLYLVCVILSMWLCAFVVVCALVCILCLCVSVCLLYVCVLSNTPPQGPCLCLVWPQLIKTSSLLISPLTWLANPYVTLQAFHVRLDIAFE